MIEVMLFYYELVLQLMKMIQLILYVHLLVIKVVSVIICGLKEQPHFWVIHQLLKVPHFPLPFDLLLTSPLRWTSFFLLLLFCQVWVASHDMTNKLFIKSNNGSLFLLLIGVSVFSVLKILFGMFVFHVFSIELLLACYFIQLCDGYSMICTLNECWFW